MTSGQTTRPGLIVVGRNSYIGGYLIEYAKSVGVANVIGVSSADCNLLDAEAVIRFFRALAPGEYTVVFLAVVNKHVRNSFESFIENMTMVQNLKEGCQLAPISSLIYFSSVDVYGNKAKTPITEQTPVAPDTWYGLAKTSAEWALSFSGELSCPVTVLRIPGIYGKSNNDPSVIGRMVAGIQKERRVRIDGAGRAMRDFVFVRDVARLVLELSGRKYNGVLNIVTGHSRSVLDVAKAVGEVLGGEFQVVHEPAHASRDFNLVFDSAKLRSLLPDFKFTELIEGIRSYLAAKLLP